MSIIWRQFQISDIPPIPCLAQQTIICILNSDFSQVHKIIFLPRLPFAWNWQGKHICKPLHFFIDCSLKLWWPGYEDKVVGLALRAAPHSTRALLSLPFYRPLRQEVKCLVCPILRSLNCPQRGSTILWPIFEQSIQCSEVSVLTCHTRIWPPVPIPSPLPQPPRTSS